MVMLSYLFCCYHKDHFSMLKRAATIFKVHFYDSYLYECIFYCDQAFLLLLIFFSSVIPVVTTEDLIPAVATCGFKQCCYSVLLSLG